MRRQTRVEASLGKAVRLLFFNHPYAPLHRCVLTPPLIARITPFLPQLKRLVDSGAVTATFLPAMRLLEKAPQPDQAPFFLDCAQAWIERHPEDTRLWVNAGYGAMLVRWLDTLRAVAPTLWSPASPLRARLALLLARLIQLGVTPASDAEQALLDSR